MTRSFRSSSASLSCRLEWRPSRLLVGAQLGLALLAAFAVLQSAMPLGYAIALAMAALTYGAWSARRELRRPVRDFLFPGDGQAVRLDGVPLLSVDLQWRGPLAFIRWREHGGGHGRLSWWPDTLPAPARRELHLAAGGLPAARHGLSMAP